MRNLEWRWLRYVTDKEHPIESIIVIVCIIGFVWGGYNQHVALRNYYENCEKLELTDTQCEHFSPMQIQNWINEEGLFHE